MFSLPRLSNPHPQPHTPDFVLYPIEKSKDRGSNTIGARLNRVEDKVGSHIHSVSSDSRLPQPVHYPKGSSSLHHRTLLISSVGFLRSTLCVVGGQYISQLCAWDIRTLPTCWLLLPSVPRPVTLPLPWEGRNKTSKSVTLKP